jgi:hypothetical protein
MGWIPYNAKHIHRDYANLYVGTRYHEMVEQIDTLVCHGAQFNEAKQKVIAETKLVIGGLARDWLDAELARLSLSGLSKEAVRAAELYDRYPSFRARGRTPDLFERAWFLTTGRR